MITVTPKHDFWRLYLDLCYFYFCESWPTELKGKSKESFLFEYEQLLKIRFAQGGRLFSLHQKEKKVIGFANSYISNDGSFNIAEFYVLPKDRKMGNGKRIYFELLEWAHAHKAKRIIVEVDKSLNNANIFWKSLGLSLDNGEDRNTYHTAFTIQKDKNL